MTVSGPTVRTFGQAGALTVTVAATSPGSGTPTGSVSLQTSTATLATLTLTNGTASFDTSSLDVDVYSIRAVYGGDDSFFSGTSAGFSLSVGKGTTTTTITPLTPAIFGQPVTITATVTTTGRRRPRRRDRDLLRRDDADRRGGAAGLGTGEPDDQRPEGGHPHAPGDLLGDGVFRTSTSAGAGLIVNKSTSTSALAVKSTAVYGERLTLTATVAPGTVVPASTAVPTGSVLFKLDGANLSVASLDGTGSASVTTTLAPGQRKLMVSYVGDSGVQASQSAETTVTVSAADATAVVDAPATTAYGQPMTLVATVAPVAPATGTPTGMIEFRDGATLIGSTTVIGATSLSRGTARFTTSALAIGDHFCPPATSATVTSRWRWRPPTRRP